MATPGVGFGQYGEGYIRFSVTQPTPRIEEAVVRLERMVGKWMSPGLDSSCRCSLRIRVFCGLWW